jgi:hypothetical protein
MFGLDKFGFKFLVLNVIFSEDLAESLRCGDKGEGEQQAPNRSSAIHFFHEMISKERRNRFSTLFSKNLSEKPGCPNKNS